MISKRNFVLFWLGSLLTCLPSISTASETILTMCPSQIASVSGSRQASSIAPSVIQSAMQATLVIEATSAGHPELDNDTSLQLGSGVVISSDGLVLTNAHVIGNRTSLTVRLSDGSAKQARLLGLDRLVDIALLRIESDNRPASPYRFLKLQLGYSPEIGEPVVALGYPMNFGLSATRGIVSGLGRAYDSVWPVDFLQHDAALNPGNSGGPLIDAQGCLIGLNTATPSQTQFDIGVGLAIPAELIGELVPQLFAAGLFPRGHFGIYVSAADQTMARALNAGSTGGLLIDDIELEGSAAVGGLLQGDVITHIDERPMRRVRDLTGYLLRRRQGEALQVKINRAGQVRTIRVTLGITPANRMAKPQFLASQPPPPRNFRSEIGFDIVADARFAQISSVVPDGLGDLGGLQSGDMILALNGTSIGGSDQAVARLQELATLGTEPVIVLRIGRPDMRVRHVTLRLSASQSRDMIGSGGSSVPQNLPSGPF